MNKIYHIMSLGLLQVLTLSSCSEEKIINEGGNINGQNEPVLTDATIIASIQTSDIVSSRANWNGESFTWNEGDKISLWNRNLGLNYKFDIVSEKAMTSTATFTGKTVITNGHKLIAVYPYQDTTAFNSIGNFVLSDTIKQSSSKPELSDKTFMIATGCVTDDKISDLEFKPITSLLNFKLKNTSGNEISLKYLTLKCDDKVFPGELSINDNGDITEFYNTRSSMTIDLNNQTLADGAEINAGLNILPTAYDDNTLMNKYSKLTVTANIWTGEATKDVILIDNIPADKFAEETGIDLSNTAYQFMPGSCYNFNFDVDYHFKVPKEGYLIDDEGTIHIYNIEGLKAWRTELVESNPTSNVIFEKEYTGNELDLSGFDWSPIEMFSGEFDGNNIILKNLNINHSGMFIQNIGTIKNLTIDSPKFKSNVEKQAGVMVSKNSGVIENCKINNVMATVVKPVKFGSIAGENSQPGHITNCNVEGGTINLNLNGNDKGNASLGCLIGENYGGTSIIKNSHVKDVTINHPSNSYGASNVGGFVGYNNVGKIEACSAISTLNINCSAQTGGFVGVNANGTVLASYCAVNINGTGSNNTGGLIGYNNGGTTIVASSYSITTSTMNHAKFGLLIGTNDGNVNNAYTVSSSDKAAIKKGNTDLGYEPKVKNNNELLLHLTEMNLAIEELDAELKWNFKKNENPETSNEQPLVLQYGVPVPGHSGDNFEDGGNI